MLTNFFPAPELKHPTMPFADNHSALYPSNIFSANNMFINRMDSLNLSGIFMSCIYPRPQNLILRLLTYHLILFFKNLHSFVTS